MGGYGYEIIGGLLIVLSSLLGEQMRPKWKVGFYILFATVAIAYSGIGIYLRGDANLRERTERQERKEELAAVRRDLSNMLAVFTGLGPSVASISADVVTVRRDLEAAKERHDPRAIAGLETRAKAAQQRVDDASKMLFVAMVPGTVRQLRSWNGNWNSSEGKALIMNVSYIRLGLLQGLEQTPEDRAISELFMTESGGSFSNWNPERAARNLESLVGRLPFAAPPYDLTGTTH